MNERCTSCSLQGRDIHELAICGLWFRLAENRQLAGVLAGPTLATFDTAEAAASEDPAIRKTVNSRRIAQCFLARTHTGECPTAGRILPGGAEAFT